MRCQRLATISFSLTTKKKVFSPSPMIRPFSGPSNKTQGPPLEPFHRLALTPYKRSSSSTLALSKVPDAKLFILGFVKVSKFKGWVYISNWILNSRISRKLTKKLAAGTLCRNWMPISQMICWASKVSIWPLYPMHATFDPERMFICAVSSRSINKSRSIQSELGGYWSCNLNTQNRSLLRRLLIELWVSDSREPRKWSRFRH